MGDYELKLTYTFDKDPTDFEERIFTFTLLTPCDIANLSFSRETLDTPVDYKLGDPTYSKTFSIDELLVSDRPYDCGLPIFEFTLADGSPLPDIFSVSSDLINGESTLSIPQSEDFSSINSYDVKIKAYFIDAPNSYIESENFTYNILNPCDPPEITKPDQRSFTYVITDNLIAD